MRYNASVTDFFKIPKWGTSMLLGAVAMLIPAIGPLVLGGWHVTGFWARGDDEDPAKFPPFDFQYFGKYLERGLWPFLVNLAASVVMIPLMMCLMIITIITCSMGMFFAAPISIFSWHHLQKQIYQLYISRGGEPIPLSPKLQDVPPLLPRA
jgi:hypothetical protein